MLIIISVALSTTAFAHYNPSEGRWTSRDPIEEKGGLNLYNMVANNPVNNWDYLGMWKATSESSGKARRVYLMEKGDTKESLAKEVSLDFNEFDKWAMPIIVQDGNNECPAYSVPNTGYIDVDTYTSGITGYYLISQKFMIQKKWEKKGIKVIYTNTYNTTKNKILSHLKSEDIYSFAYIGHGASGNLTKIDDPDWTDDNNTKQVRAKNGIGFDTLTKGIINAGKYTRYGIFDMYIIACDSSENRSLWRKNVSSLGTLTTVKLKKLRGSAFWKEKNEVYDDED